MASYMEMRGLDKSFPGVQAVDHVDLTIRENEIHVLLGENGAGKSTLVQLLSGAQRPDEGKILLRGEEIQLQDPRHALDLGIGMVYQELSLVPSLSVAENIVLGSYPLDGKTGLLDWDKVQDTASQILDKLGVKIDPSAKVRDISIADQQLTEVAKTMAHDVDLIILDEPTSALSGDETERLFETLENLKEHGVTFIYITHVLEEALELGDRVTVLRDGEKIDTLPTEESDKDALVNMMVGRKIENQYPKEFAEIGEALLEAEGLTADKLEDVSLELREGEVLGIAGLLGAGRAELAEVLFGISDLKKGKIKIRGENVEIDSPFKAIDLGLGYLTKDRHEGLVSSLPVDANITLSSLNKICQSFYLNNKSEEELAEDFVRELEIATPSLEQLVRYLSGGNQQKVVLAKWLASESDIFILHDPTRGIDVATKVEVYQLMNRLTKEGKGVILISSELPEQLAMSDRVAVMRDGRIVAEYDHDEVSREEVMLHAAGRSSVHV